MTSRIRIVAIGLFFLVIRLGAQDARGTILGRITDATGAVVDGARVEAVNTDTGVHSVTTSNSAGDYILTYLLPGSWNLTVENAGFKSGTRQGIVLRDGARVSTDIRLEVGDSKQTVEVVAAAPLLDTSTASLGQSYDQREIRDLPTKDGMVLLVATFAPGVTFTPQSSAYVRPFDTSSPSSMSVNGTRPGSNEFQVDGTPNLQGGQIAYSPPQSVVGEMKVQTSSFDASTGFNTGAVMNMTIKSGTNVLHGSLEYFMQNPVLNADNYFRLSTGKPGFRIHRYGASLTGPLVLPKIYNGKNRTFFTYGFEGIWSFDPSPWVVEAVPTAAERIGDLSALLKVNPSNQIYDPYSTTPVAGGRFQRIPVPNNIIPPSLINPVSANIAKLWDQPNQAGNADGLNNYTKGKNAQDTYDNNLIRLDHNISDRQRMYGRYNQTALTRPENIRQNLTVGDNFYRYNHGAAIDHVLIVSPSFVIDSRYSFMRFVTGFTPYQQGWDLAGLGFNQSFINQVAAIDPRALRFPTINTSPNPNTNPFSQLGGVNNNNRQIYMTHEAAVSLTNVFGRHTVRSSFTFRELLQNSYNLGASSGSFTFDSTYTNGPFNNSGNAPLGQEFASFLYGLPGSGTFPINDNFAEKTRYFALYAQDDWKLSTKLTISAGLRYEMPSPLTERFNRSVKGFDATATQSINAQVLANYAQNPIPQVPATAFRLNGGLTFAGSGELNRGLWSTTFKNLMPRFGIAYSVTPTTVIRTGYGIYYSPLGITSVDVNQTGFSSSTAYVGSVDNGQTYVASLSNPFPNGFTRPLGAAGGVSTFLGQNVTFFDQNLRNPYSQRWQFAVQHQFPSNILVEVSYVGNRGTRLTALQDRNPIPGQYLSTLPTRDQTVINALAAAVPNPFYPLLPRTNLSGTTVALSQLLKPFPQFSAVTELTNAGSSWYHGFQARANKRFSQGLSVNYSFTWSKFMEATSYLNPFDTRPEHVISDQDRPFRSVVTVMYELPFGKGKVLGNSANPFVSRVIGGWQLQGIYTNQSGQALGFGNAILTCPLDQIPLSNATVGQWFNTSCFNRVANQQLASNVRAVSTRFSGIRGPGLNTVDLSVIKNTQINEKVRLQFHAQAINALNHPQFSNPNTTLTSTALGQITGTVSWQRVIEFGMRVIF